jgi:transcription elongation factor Elf1
MKLNLIQTDFNCPQCNEHHKEKDYIQKWLNGNGLIYLNCKKCKESIGLNMPIGTKVNVWLKKDESNYETIKP